jgi:hypothetical protein
MDGGIGGSCFCAMTTSAQNAGFVRKSGAVRHDKGIASAGADL